MDNAIDRMIDTASGGRHADLNQHDSYSKEFISSLTWQGTKVGYYFGTSDRYGTGYHLDDHSYLKAMSNNNNIDVNGDDRGKKRSV